jgi:hypothetical protein
MKDCSSPPAGGSSRSSLESLTSQKPLQRWRNKTKSYYIVTPLCVSREGLGVSSCCKKDCSPPAGGSRSSGSYSPIKNPGTFAPGFFFVDKRFEISNLSLIRDMVELVELAEVL